uniref:Protein kinase domain-containing protein n=2 Tax=Oryza TaxID=4527 RepID=A0A0D3HEK4_9ORYZ
MSGPSGSRPRRQPRSERFLADELVGRINDLRLDENVVDNITDQQYSQHLGGYIRSFSFRYEDGAPFSQGFVYLESPLQGGIMELEATFVVLTEEEGRMIAQKVYDDSNQIYGYGGAIANIYLSAYCNKLKRWVLGYEKFECLFDSMIPNFLPFYESQSRISIFWIRIIRQVIESLSVLHGNGVMHGSLYSPQSYVLDSSSNIKLINIGRYSVAGRSTSHRDITSFFGYLGSQSCLDVSSSKDWHGFEYLYNSKEAMNNTR